MKRDRKLFLDGLSCRVSRMKRDYSFQLLRGPKELGSAKPSADASAKLQPETGARGNVKYHEMIPGSPPKGRHSHHKISKNKFQNLCGLKMQLCVILRYFFMFSIESDLQES